MSPLSSRPQRSGPSDLAVFARSLIDAVTPCFSEGGVAEPGGNLSLETPELYIESHYALAQMLIYLLDDGPSDRLDMADRRLRQWERRGYPARFFNGMAICLAQILARENGIEHPMLRETLERVRALWKPAYAEAYDHPGGNNMYFMQLVSDVVLHPLATGLAVTDSNLAFLFTELERYRSGEGFYYDAPRSAAQGSGREFPMTYCMTFLFLLALCYALHGDRRFKARFTDGMLAVLPLMTRDGGFSYFGRSDNTTFADGVTLFTLRAAAALDAGLRDVCLAFARRLAAVYRSTPRTPQGYLQANRFAGPDTQELVWSRDPYAFPSNYSVASAAYVLLAEFLYQTPEAETRTYVTPRIGSNSADSRDLGVAKLCHAEAELFVRTGSQPEAKDRRYSGPTILRFQVGDQLVVGAVPRLCSRDAAVKPPDPRRLLRVPRNVVHRYALGNEELDPRFAGFIPVLIDGSDALVPAWPSSCLISNNCVQTEHEMLRVRLRGIVPALQQLARLTAVLLPLHRRSADTFRPEPGIRLLRRVAVFEDSFQINDTLRGALTGKLIELCVRTAPGGEGPVEDLRYSGTLRAWSSDGPVRLDRYSLRCRNDEMCYRIVVRGRSSGAGSGGLPDSHGYTERSPTREPEPQP